MEPGSGSASSTRATCGRTGRIPLFFAIGLQYSPSDRELDVRALATPIMLVRPRAVCSLGRVSRSGSDFESGDHIMWPLIRFGVVGEAWRLYKRHWVVWSLAMLIVLVGFSAVNGALSAVLKTGRGPHLGGFRLFLPASKPLAYVIATMVTSFFAGGMLRMASNQVRGLTPQIEDLFNVTDCWFDLLLFGFLASVLIALAHSSA